MTGYTVSVRQSDGSTFAVDLVNCDMSASVETSCVVPVATVRSEPYNLEWGSEVYAKVSAKNIYGDSAESEAANGAIIIKEPAAPLNFVNI